MLDTAPAQISAALIIDDEESDVFWCRRVLTRSGRYDTVYAARSGREALQIFVDHEASRRRWPGRFPPLVVFVDINMPGMNGFEFLAELSARRTELAENDAMPAGILVLSSSDDVRDRQRADAFDVVDGYLVKPITEALAIEVADHYGERVA